MIRKLALLTCICLGVSMLVVAPADASRTRPGNGHHDCPENEYKKRHFMAWCRQVGTVARQQIAGVKAEALTRIEEADSRGGVSAVSSTATREMFEITEYACYVIYGIVSHAEDWFVHCSDDAPGNRGNGDYCCPDYRRFGMVANSCYNECVALIRELADHRDEVHAARDARYAELAGDGDATNF